MSDSSREIVYCIVPRELARVHEALVRHFRDEPGVEVVGERRAGERRRGEERRGAVVALGGDRRRVRNLAGRRIAERRAAVLPVEVPLPRRLRRHADQLVFVERLEPPVQEFEDLDTGRLVTRFQAGDESVFNELYMRYFHRVYAYLRMALRDPVEAQDACQEVFLRVYQALPRYERRRQPFRAWLFVLVRNYALDELRRRHPVELREPNNLQSIREERAPADLTALDWISDRELLLFIERLPLAQQQVLILRYMLDLDNAQIATMLDRSRDDVRQLHVRAVRFLEERLRAVGRCPDSGERIRMGRGRKQYGVLRARRWALLRPS